MANQQAEQTFKRLVNRYLDETQYVQNIAEESPFFPQQVYVEPTNACNLRCVHCHHHVSDSGQRAIKRPFGLMSMEVFRKVVDEVAPFSCQMTLNVQGEPTLHPRVVDMVTYAKENGLFTSLLTNGTRLTEQLAQTLVDLRLDRIVFSFDGAEKGVYESVRIRSKFEPTLRNVLGFLRLNHEAGHDTHVCMSIILQERTSQHIEAYKRYFGRLPVDRIFVSDLLNLSGGSGASREVAVDQLRRGPRTDWPICRIPWENLTVNWDGEVSACPLDYNVAYSLGNVRDMGLQKMWNSDLMRQFRRAHLDRDYTAVEANGPLCGSCNCLWDPEYDLRRYKEFAVEAIYRQAVQFAHQFATAPDSDKEDQNYRNLLLEVETLDARTREP